MWKTPALSTVILHKDPKGVKIHPELIYQSVIGKLNFVEKSSRPDLAFAMHQCAQFSSDPKQSHSEAVKRIGHYLKGTQHMGITLNPNYQKSFQCWVNADFAGTQKPEGSQADPMTSKSHPGWGITCAGCPITWVSKLQTLMALSTTEAKYVALSMAMQE